MVTGLQQNQIRIMFFIYCTATGTQLFLCLWMRNRIILLEKRLTFLDRTLVSRWGGGISPSPSVPTLKGEWENLANIYRQTYLLCLLLLNNKVEHREQLNCSSKILFEPEWKPDLTPSYVRDYARYFYHPAEIFPPIGVTDFQDSMFLIGTVRYWFEFADMRILNSLGYAGKFFYLS